MSLPGFRTYVQTGIVLQVGATPTINVVLALGAVEESVTVEGAAPLVDVQAAPASATSSRTNGSSSCRFKGARSTDLLVLSGAAVQTAVVSSRGMPGGVNISVAGGRRSASPTCSTVRCTTTRRTT